jgi:ABC-2 type transport system permease protein
VNGPLLRHTVAVNVTRLLVISVGLALMGTLMPVMFSAFGQEVAAFMESSPLLRQFADFGGGDMMVSLGGSIALAFTHPFTLLLLGIMAVAFPALAIAGERDRGTLEVTLSRPISRRGLLGTLYVAGLGFLALLLLVLVVAVVVATTAVGLGHELPLDRVAQLWLAAWLLFVAFMSLAFAVSVSSDRAGPAIGIPAAFILINYLAWAIGSLWPDVRWLEDYSMLNLLKARDILSDGLAPGDALVLVAFAALCLGFALVRFPRRDLPAPS